MKIKLLYALAWLTGCSAYGQAAFIYDQQSTNQVEGGAFLQSDQPMGQSFTPTFSSVGFIILNLYDSDVLHNSGATVLVNLRSTSITGTIMSSTAPVFIPDGFSGTTNFIFTTLAAVSPGATYYFQPVIQSGDTIGSRVTDGSYAGGTAFVNGSAWTIRDLWFREGIVAVPEPSSVLLTLLGGGVLAWRCRKR